MYANETHVSAESVRFFHTPSLTAKSLFFYPVILGRYEYKPGYRKSRSRFDNFLLMLVEKGNMEILLNGKQQYAPQGSAVLIDCYEPHEYYTEKGCRTIWLHFDGAMARAWYAYLTECGQDASANILLPQNYHSVHQLLESLLHDFRNSQVPEESAMSITITQILHMLLPDHQAEADTLRETMRRITTFISEHFSEDLSLEILAKQAGLSPYYFSRVFKKETGLTPHQYLIATRISSAKYYLSTTDHTIASIALSTGFKDESAFCYAFRIREGVTPGQYRAGSRPQGRL